MSRSLLSVRSGLFETSGSMRHRVGPAQWCFSLGDWCYFVLILSHGFIVQLVLGRISIISVLIRVLG